MITMLPVIVAIAAVAAFFVIAMYWKSDRPQHAGGGEGAFTVWQLIAHVEAERHQRERGGRHRLREPADAHDLPRTSTQDALVRPSPEIQRRIVEALHRL
ncbi:hypothetical protein [Saccharopolyspora spinosa]|uniref:Uncharacterized protein n=1 Tax=Saccharopolyspora spinosa TaxID=60894 RepID=A0A2N3XT23_SACSN|nr:hypothetical protein [Saccharopolyspora spinosa]PKW13740.1 hypothetical protein A8926_1295 [Saccharopolyspora spinosa]